jgi:hypothetical protein
LKRKRGRKREEPGLIDRAMGWSFASALLAGWANSGAGVLAVVGVAVVTGLGVFLAAAFLAGLLESALGGPRRAWPVGWALSQSGACALVAPLSSENSGWVAAAGIVVAVLGAAHLARPVSADRETAPISTPARGPAAPRSDLERRADSLLADLRAALSRAQDAHALVDLPRLRREVEASARQLEQALAQLSQLEAAPEGDGLGELRTQAEARVDALLEACRACRDALLAHEAACQLGDAAAISDGTARVQQATVALVELAPKS